jgi:hypothetical protein
MFKRIIFISILVVIIGIGYWAYRSKPEELTVTEKACLSSGGQVSYSSCCKSAGDFPNLCLIGACGCSLGNSSQVKKCDCGEGKCFDGKECVQQQQPLITIYCTNDNCSEQKISQGAGTLAQGCYRDLNECLSYTGSKEMTLCTKEQRTGDVCFDIYDPVCAKVNIQCVRAPCDPIYQTYSNSCEACRNTLVESYIKGECRVVK